jgi:hypothetical protein
MMRSRVLSAFGIFLLTLVDNLPQLAGRLEGRNEMFIKRNGLARTRITRHARQSLLSSERAKSSDFDVIAVGERIRHGLKKTIDENLRFELCDSGCGCNAGDNVSFSHGRE